MSVVTIILSRASGSVLEYVQLFASAEGSRLATISPGRLVQAPPTVALGGVTWSLAGGKLTVEKLTAKLSDAKKRLTGLLTDAEKSSPETQSKE